MHSNARSSKDIFSLILLPLQCMAETALRADVITHRRCEMDAILAKAGIEERPFTRGALADLPPVADPLTWTPSQQDMQERRDLTSPENIIFSIDPPGQYQCSSKLILLHICSRSRTLVPIYDCCCNAEDQMFVA